MTAQQLAEDHEERASKQWIVWTGAAVGAAAAGAAGYVAWRMTRKQTMKQRMRHQAERALEALRR